METLIKGAESFGLCISNEQAEAFDKYMELLLEWNNKFNLTAITDRNDIISKHFLDSIAVVSVIGDFSEGKSLIDVGSGAGFPGLPLKIMLSGLNVTLIDSVGKKVAFLQEVIKELALEDIVAIKTRAEDLANKPDYREKFDYSTARAVSRLSVIAEYCLPFVKKGGKFISLKSADAQDEINEAKAAILELGGEISDIKQIKIPFTDITRSLIVIDKTSNTPPQFPRKPGKAAKSPII